jgi:hypothetical protein
MAATSHAIVDRMAKYTVEFVDERLGATLPRKEIIDAYFPSQAAKILGETYDFENKVEKVIVRVTAPDGSTSDHAVHIQKHVYVQPADGHK